MKQINQQTGNYQPDILMLYFATEIKNVGGSKEKRV